VKLAHEEGFGHEFGLMSLHPESYFFKNLVALHGYQNIYALHIGEQSHLTFGGFDPAFKADQAPEYLRSLGESGTTITSNSMTFGQAQIDPQQPFELNFHSDKIGLGCEPISIIMHAIQEANPGFKYDGNCRDPKFDGKCPQNVPSLDFVFQTTDFAHTNSSVYSLPASSWFYFDGDTCWALLENTSSDENPVLGRPFLENFYTAYDLENNRVGLVPYKNAPTPKTFSALNQ